MSTSVEPDLVQPCGACAAVQQELQRLRRLEEEVKKALNSKDVTKWSLIREHVRFE